MLQNVIAIGMLNNCNVLSVYYLCVQYCPARTVPANTVFNNAPENLEPG